MEGQIVNSPDEIQKKLRHIRPTRIAVAFVGENWGRYVIASELSEIVLSPTVGSNPRAIEDLANKIGWGNVHFLDNLHSKIYIGSSSALMGSCNLSDNGMGEGRLEEIAIFLQEKHHLTQLNKSVDCYIELAQQMYPTEESKRFRLSELIQQRKEMPRYCPPGEYGKLAPDINSYTYTLSDHIHIAFYVSGKMPLNEKIIRANSDVPATQEINDYYTQQTQFRNEDSIKEGDWILLWQAKNNCLPSGNVEWMYVDEIIENGCDDDQYKKLVGQINKCIRTPPFKLDPKTKKRICDVIASEEFKELRPNAEYATWDSNRADELVPQFIEAVKRNTGS